MSRWDCDRRVYEALSALDIPGAHYAFPEGGAPRAPFFVYSLDDAGEVFADDSNWSRLPRYRVQLLEREQSPELEEAVADALRDAFGPVRTVEDWSQSEHARIVSFYFTVKDTEGATYAQEG